MKEVYYLTFVAVLMKSLISMQEISLTFSLQKNPKLYPHSVEIVRIQYFHDYFAKIREIILGDEENVHQISWREPIQQLENSSGNDYLPFFRLLNSIIGPGNIRPSTKTFHKDFSKLLDKCELPLLLHGKLQKPSNSLSVVDKKGPV